MIDAIPIATRSENADAPSGRWPRMSSAIPPMNAHASPASNPPAIAQTTPKTRTGWSAASPIFRYGTTVNSASAATTAIAAAMVCCMVPSILG